jgi:hypothetical protein
MKQFIAIVVIILVAVVAFIIISLKPREITPKDIHPVPGLVNNQSESPVTQNPPAESPSTDAASANQTSPAEPVSYEKSSTVVTSQENEVSTEGYYFIVINSFRNLNMAKEKAANLKTKLKSEIIVLPLSRDGYYRLSYGKYSTKEDAEHALISVRINIRPEAWIYYPGK